ncbi:transposase family protein [Streptomyces sp. NPDC058409]|uniref:transposase family protein n=1 Tax=Streptomyces sp. NPDC058409 TaxID=3346484 RepID=UPI003660C8BF
MACPGCATVSNRVHSTYGRCLADTPVGDRPVLIELTMRRLYCENVRCPRRTFAEQVKGLTVRHGRRTPAARRVLEAVAVALGGRAGSRLAAVLHTRVSRTTVLRTVMALPDPGWTVPKVPCRRLRRSTRAALRHRAHRLRDRTQRSGPLRLVDPRQSPCL